MGLWVFIIKPNTHSPKTIIKSIDLYVYLNPLNRIHQSSTLLGSQSKHTNPTIRLLSIRIWEREREREIVDLLLPCGEATQLSGGIGGCLSLPARHLLLALNRRPEEDEIFIIWVHFFQQKEKGELVDSPRKGLKTLDRERERDGNGDWEIWDFSERGVGWYFCWERE